MLSEARGDSATRPYAAANEKRMKNAYESDGLNEASVSQPKESRRNVVVGFSYARSHALSRAVFACRNLFRLRPEQQAQVGKGARERGYVCVCVCDRRQRERDRWLGMCIIRVFKCELKNN